MLFCIILIWFIAFCLVWFRAICNYPQSSFSPPLPFPLPQSRSFSLFFPTIIYRIIFPFHFIAYISLLPSPLSLLPSFSPPNSSSPVFPSSSSLSPSSSNFFLCNLLNIFVFLPFQVFSSLLFFLLLLLLLLLFLLCLFLCICYCSSS